jgi:membrane-bound lytic murein transglycosylase A
MQHARFGRAAILALSLALTGTSASADHTDRKGDHTPPPPAPLKFDESKLEPLAWRDVEGWAQDDHAEAFVAFLKSCRALIASDRLSRDTRPMREALVSVCRRARAALPLDLAGARAFFEDNFRAVRISKLVEEQGFLTGYYEPIVEGSRVPTGEFTVPVYRRPGDLIVQGKRRKAGSGFFPNKGKVYRKLGKRKIVAYHDRAAIEDGALDGRGLEICWLKDPVDLFFIQIQGSARIRLEDGAVLRINYDAHNGHAYTPIGRILIERKEVPREEMSMQRIREWIAAHPEEGKALRRMNKSYVFFRITELSEFDEAVGAQGIPLTAVRSLAVDRGLHVYGTPFFLQADLPIATGSSTTKFRRLLIAQDTGSAIVGPARGDIYFGAGDEAARSSGRIRNNGRFVMLVPRDIDPVEFGAQMPLPRPDPRKSATAKATAPTDAAAPATSEAATPPVPTARPQAAPKPPRKGKSRREASGHAPPKP